MFKYINKGSDRVTTVFYENNDKYDGDEIKMYEDYQYLTVPEASWRIFQCEVQYKQPSFMRLSVPLPNEQSVIYEDHDNLESVLDNDRVGKTMFLAWMEANEQHANLANNVSYLDFLKHFVFKKNTCNWNPRKNGFQIGQLYHIPINSGELYYLSILLGKVKGAELMKTLEPLMVLFIIHIEMHVLLWDY